MVRAKAVLCVLCIMESMKLKTPKERHMTESEGARSQEETQQKGEIREYVLFKESSPCDVSDDIHS